jgi:hypothetical protein
LLVEAKGVELTPFAQVTSDPTVIAKSLKSSVIKEINQAAATVGLLESLRKAGKPLAPAGPYYCVIATLRLTFLGTARTLVEVAPTIARNIRS